LPGTCRGKDFLTKGGERTLAITEKRKHELVVEYQEWAGKSRAIILSEYTGMSMKEIDALRAKVREAGGEFHIIKNTLAQLAFEQAGMSVPAGYLEGSTAASFAFEDAPAIAKAMTDFARTVEFLKIKGGFLESRPMDSMQVIALAELPPLPVMRAQVLGTLLAPASQLARTLAEPARSLAAVIQAYAGSANAESGAAPAEGS
jgi:large subunit ribosomal protein L10